MITKIEVVFKKNAVFIASSLPSPAAYLKMKKEKTRSYYIYTNLDGNLTYFLISCLNSKVGYISG